MKKVFASFLILFLMITNCGYAMQQEHFTNIDSYQKDSIFNEEKNNGSKKIKISEPSITKEKSEKKTICRTYYN